jgi:hypothetical protein
MHRLSSIRRWTFILALLLVLCAALYALMTVANGETIDPAEFLKTAALSASIFAVASAVFAGPVYLLAHRLGIQSWVPWTVLGAIAGAIPALLILISLPFCIPAGGPPACVGSAQSFPAIVRDTALAAIVGMVFNSTAWFAWRKTQR